MSAKTLFSALLCAVFVFVLQTAYAQDRTVTGKVTDSKDGSPVVGASVQPKGGTTGTSTRSDGTFSITVGSGVTSLIISSVGYEVKEVSIAGVSNVEVSFVPSAASSLNEVVVTGYGTARKRDLTGAVTSLKAKDFNQGVVLAPDQLLQNKVAGLEITNNSGQPGVATTIKIRGNNSIRAVNNPLYVIDGVPLDGRSARPSVNLGANGLGFGTTPDGNPLTYINPNDIAQIDVLKDASSAAIYGSRGANGVIVITTKKGGAGQPKLEVGTSIGFAAGYMKRYETLDAGQFREAIKKYGLNTSLDGGKDVDALKEITQDNLSQNYNLAFSGGSDVGRFRASFLGSRTQGFIRKSYLDKYLGSFAGQYKFIDKKLSIDFNLIAGHTTENIPNVSNTAGSQGNLISAALSWNPTMDLRDNAGNFIFPTNGSGNPLALIDGISDLAKVNSFLGNISAGYKLLNNLEYKFLYAINHSTGERNTNLYGWLQGYASLSGLGYGIKSFAKLTSQTFTHTLNYRAKLTTSLNLDALAGFEYWKSDFQNSSFAAGGFNTNLNYATRINIPYTSMLANGNTQFPPSTFVNPQTELQSYFGRAVLNYADRYIVTATIRADGSSKFGENNKYGYFPSVAAKWNIFAENFMKGTSLFSNLALRASWGITGNQEFPAGASQEQFGFSGYNNASQQNVANPDLKWEETNSVNVGLDFGFKNGKIYGSVDYYKKNTTNILFQSTAIQPAPASIYFINIPGHLINKGIEFFIAAELINRTDFGLDVNFNISNNKNLLEDFVSANGAPISILTGQINGQGVSGTLSQIITNNQPVNEFYLKPFNGFDANGIQQIGPDPAFAGDPNPQTLYGFGANLRYQKFGLTINTGGAGGYYIYNNTATNITNISSIVGGRNIDLAAYNSAELPASAVGASTRFLEKGNYFKLRNATLRYNVGNVARYIRDLNVYVTGTNLFVITKFTGFDPEVNIDKSNNNYPSRSIEYIPYPTPRMITVGLNFTL
ncbi:MAG TPA: SusC/RagA family TonB-linked outer membrane protein [Chitinophagaceae bacterium]|nr:SusC/RagA family TonB-linked outer membrane protein [Chitinophagaceae bacterium]